MRPQWPMCVSYLNSPTVKAYSSNVYVKIKKTQSMYVHTFVSVLYSGYIKEGEEWPGYET